MNAKEKSKIQEIVKKSSDIYNDAYITKNNIRYLFLKLRIR